MPSSEGPLLHRRRLGNELRRLRGERTLDEVAAGTLISTSKLSRLENGQGVPNARDIRDLVIFHELDAQAADGSRRLDDPADFVRYEVALALERGKVVIPVLIDDVSMPLASRLPEILQALPDLRDPLEYRFVNRDLLLVDVDADLIVDILPEAIPRQ